MRLYVILYNKTNLYIQVGSGGDMLLTVYKFLGYINDCSPQCWCWTSFATYISMNCALDTPICLAKDKMFSSRFWQLLSVNTSLIAFENSYSDSTGAVFIWTILIFSSTIY